MSRKSWLATDFWLGGLKIAFNLLIRLLRLCEWFIMGIFFFLLLISSDRAAAHYLARNHALGLYSYRLSYEKANK